MNKKKLFVIVLILIVIICSFNVIANGSSEETPEIEPEVIQGQPVELEPAPQWVIDKVSDYIISMIGEDYFAQHFQLQQSQTNINIDKIGTKYVLTYIYLHNLKDHPSDTPYQVEYQFTLRTDPDGKLVEYRGIKYRGPKNPYQFLISKSEANSTAIEYGLQIPTEISLSYGGQGYNSDTPIEEGTYTWVVWSKKCIKGLNIGGLYIDVDTGNIINKKTSYKTCIGGEDEEFVSTDKEELISSDKEETTKPNQNFQIKNHKNFFQKLIDWIKSLFRK